MYGCMYVYMDVTLSCGHDNLKRIADKLMRFAGLILALISQNPSENFFKILNIFLFSTFIIIEKSVFHSKTFSIDII